MVGEMEQATQNGKRRIDRILASGFADDLGGLPLDEVRARRDECLAEREYLSLLRRMVQGRADILRAERQRRSGGGGGAGETDQELVERLSKILADEGPRGPVRGEAVRVGSGEEELSLARRRVERLVADAALSDPGSLSEEDLSAALDRLETEEREVSATRASVMEVHDRLQDELKRRFKEDPSQAIAR